MSSNTISILALAVPLAGVIGLFVGSFLNVVVYRTPLGLSVAAPRSFCPTCDRQLLWWENVPVVSWMALRGRCRTCHLPISVRYPLVELATAVVFALTTWAWRGNLIAAAYCSLAAALIAVALIEYGGQRAPLSVAAVGTGLALVIITVGGGWQHRWNTVVGAVVGTVVAATVYALLRQRDPGCVDAREYGRSALLLVGCWSGGLGVRAVTIGASFWIVAYFVCMVAARASARQGVTVGDSAPTLMRTVNPVLGAPLVTAIALGMTASLIAGT